MPEAGFDYCATQPHYRSLASRIITALGGGEVSFDLLQHPRQRDGEREGSIEVGLSEVLYPLHSRHRGRRKQYRLQQRCQRRVRAKEPLQKPAAVIVV
jgi:hypothetical protein